jgi:FlaA1/EpsC-like NDP-sugar epimerase
MQLFLSRFRTHRIPASFKRIAQNGLVDVLIVFLSYGIAVSALELNNWVNFTTGLVLTIIFALILVGMLLYFGVYQRIWSRTSGHGITLLIKAVVTASVVIVPLDLLNQNRLPLSLVLLGNFLALCGFIMVRYRSRLATSFAWRWKAILGQEFSTPQTRVMIIGAGESGQTLAWRLMHRFSHNRYKIVGFIDDDLNKQNMYVETCKVLGTRKDIERLAESFSVDLIVVAIHNIAGPDFREILTFCERTKALVKIVPDLEAIVNAKRSQAMLRNVQAEDFIGRSTVVRFEAVDLKPITQKVVLITGSAGSIGSELSRQIMLYSPTRVILLDNNESGLHDLATELRGKYPSVELVPALVDITVRSSLQWVYEKFRPQIIFHAAAYKHVPMLEYYPQEAWRVNIGGTRNLAELAREFKVERFVLISSDKAVNPSSVMGATKRVGELMLHSLAQEGAGTTLFASVRFGNVLGSRGSVVPTFNRQIDHGGPVTVTHPEMTRYFMSIPEAVNLILHAACLTQGDDIYVLRMGEVVRILELAERMIRLRGLRPYTDIPIEFTGIRPGEKMHEELFHSEEHPIETLHPDILKVNTWRDEFSWEDFLNRLERLSQDAYKPQSNIIDRLLELITLNTTHIPEKAPSDVEVEPVEDQHFG